MRRLRLWLNACHELFGFAPAAGGQRSVIAGGRRSVAAVKFAPALTEPRPPTHRVRKFMTASGALLILASVAVPSGRAAEIGFVRVWPGWRDADTFDRISEYFTGREDTGWQVILRTHPDTRAGFYYLVRVANPAAPLTDVKFVLHVIAPTSPATKTYTFRTNLARGQTVFDLGLTGPEWPSRKIHPVAWRLELQDAAGRVLASENSFLWAKPAR